MKATVNGVTVEGTPNEIADLMRAMGTTQSKMDSSILTPKQREAYNALARHPAGAHYTVVAEELGADEHIIGTRLANIARSYDEKLVKRIAAGTYKVV
jgi:O6-methylguanine-DNA--protein-cysteine methyltransferase